MPHLEHVTAESMTMVDDVVVLVVWLVVAATVAPVEMGKARNGIYDETMHQYLETPAKHVDTYTLD